MQSGRSRAILRLLLLGLSCAALPGLAGCYAAAVGIAIGIVSLSESSSGRGNAAPEAFVVGEPSRPNGEIVLITLRVIHPTESAEVAVHWQPEDGARGFEQANGSMSPRDRNGHVVFTWAARQQLEQALGRSSALVRLKAIVRDARGVRESASPTPIWAGNDPPGVGSVSLVGSGIQSGTVAFRVRLSDTCRDRATVRAELLPENGDPTSIHLIGATLLDTLTPEEDVKEHTIVWESHVEFGGQASDSVRLRFSASDEVEEASGQPRELTLAVDNNEDPEVEILELATAPDRSFDVPVRFVLRDDESHRATVVLQWTLETEPFPDLPFGEGAFITPEDIRRLTSDDSTEAIELRRSLRIPTAAPLVYRGRIDGASPPEGRRIRETDFVRHGLVFRPPTPGGSRGLGEGCSGGSSQQTATLGPSSDVVLIGRPIRFPEPEDPAADHDPSGASWQEILGFDPATSEAILADGESPPARSQYELIANEPLLDLSSARSPEGIVHTFLWDSAGDLRSAGAPRNASVLLRAVAIDAQAGRASSARGLRFEGGILFEHQSIQTPNRLSAAALRDVDGDGLLDLVLASANAKEVYLLLQSATEGLPSGLEEPMEIEGLPQQLAAADVTGDGLVDLIVATQQPNRLEVYRGAAGNPAGRIFAGPPSIVPLAGPPRALATGDVTGDGIEDLLVARPPGVLEVHAATPLEPVLSLRGSLPTGAGPRSLALGHLDGDALLDVVVTCFDFTKGELDVYHQLPDPGAPGRNHLVPASPVVLDRAVVDDPFAVVVDDVTSDGKSEVIVAARNSNKLAVFALDDSGVLARDPLSSIPARTSPVAVVAGDFDGDGRKDVLAASSAGRALSLHSQGDDGVLRAAPTLEILTEEQLQAVVRGDVNGDGREDLVALSNAAPGRATVYLQGFAGSLPSEPSQILSLGERREPVAVALGDVNGDGRPDIVSADRGSGRASVFLQTASATISDGRSFELAAGQEPRDVAIGDVDADGRNDVLLLDGAGKAVLIHIQGPCGELGKEAPRTLTLPGTAASLAVGDLDDDGRNDVAVSLNVGGQGRIRLHFQETGGTFREEPVEGFSIDGRPGSIALGDVDGDGLTDLATAVHVATNSGGVAVFLQGDAGLFIPQTVLQCGPDPNGVALVDVNGDGGMDIVVADLNGSVFLQDPLLPGRFLLPPRELKKPDSRAAAIAAGDLNGDGRDDAILGNGNSPRLSLYYQRCFEEGNCSLGTRLEDSTHFGPSQTVSSTGTPGAIAVGDLGGDGRADVIVAVPSSNAINIFLAR